MNDDSLATTWLARPICWQQLTRRDWLKLLFMLVLVPLAGEPQIHPFAGTDFASFRVSFGSPVFLLFLLWLDHFPRFFCGVATGLAVLLFRAGLDCLGYGLPFATALYAHVPTFFYYFMYASLFGLPSLDKKSIYEQALTIAGWAIFAEIGASIVELSAMNAMRSNMQQSITPDMLLRLAFIAVLRCFFILSFFFLFQLYSTEARLARKTKEKNRLSLLIAGLYEEVFELHGTLRNSEQVTHDCYNIYDELKQHAASPHADSETDRHWAREILRIAGECHEIKKANQRIYASLSELTRNRHVDDYLPPAEIIRIMVHAESKYARALGKDITFQTDIEPGLPPVHVFTLLSILNNLAANAIEAIKKGRPTSISVKLNRKAGCTTADHPAVLLHIELANTGSAIPPSHLTRVFRPGYTTKFDSSGRASSGVGLTYVKHQTEALNGHIIITSDGQDEVRCLLDIPLEHLTEPLATTSILHTSDAPPTSSTAATPITPTHRKDIK